MKSFFFFFIFCSSIALSFPQTEDTVKQELTANSRSDNKNAKTFRGAVIDINSKLSLEDVVVMIVDTANVIRAMQNTDSLGVFYIAGIKHDRFNVRTYRYGYISTLTGPYNLAAHDTLTMLVKLEAVPISLGEIVVTATRTIPYLDRIHFYERKKQGLGYYVTRNDFKDRGLLNIYDIFRGIPGVIVKNNTIHMSRYAASSFRRTKPQPLIYVDGMLNYGGNLDWLNPESVQAVEVYKGLSAPAQYSRGRLGGVILIWTRN